MLLTNALSGTKWLRAKGEETLTTHRKCDGAEPIIALLYK